MRDDINDHFFACHLLWWSLRVSFSMSELANPSPLAERLEDYGERLEELGTWLMDEIVRAGRVYLVEGSKQGIAGVEAAEIEQTFRRSLSELAARIASVVPVDVSRLYCVYVAECDWALAILRAFVELEQSLVSKDATTMFREIQKDIEDLAGWLEAQRDEVTSMWMSPSERQRLHAQMDPAIAAAARAWRDAVRAYSARYPR